jgi:hypothetical protein
VAESLNLEEPMISGYIPPKPFGLNEDGLPPHEILRLLLGSVNVKEVSTGRLVKISENSFRKNSRRLCKPNRISKFIFEDDISISEYEIFVKLLSAKNYDFFSRVRRELSLALLSQRDKRYTESFLYFYRILEMISVAFPLLYASTQSDFKKSHEFLRKLLNSDRDRDLKVLNSAVPIISQQAPNLNGLTFDFSTEGFDSAWVSELKKQMEKCGINRVAGLEFEPEQNILFRVPFNSIPSTISQFRNRMFHYRISEDNLDLGSIGGSEAVCRMLVREAVHWFALTYAELLRVMARRQF